jgi:hypothetical protein
VPTPIGYWLETRRKKPVGRQRLKWVHISKTGLGELEWSGVEWIGVVQNRDQWKALVNAIVNHRVP